jgi:transposase, IS5 family
VVEADIDDPTDADLLEHAVRKLGGLVRRIKGRGAASRTRFRDRGRAAGRRMKQLARTLRRRTGVAMGEVDRLTGGVAAMARRTLREVQVVAGNARRAAARRSGDGRLGRLVGELEETITATQRLLAQTDQRLAGDRVIPDRLVSLADPDARPIRKGKPRHPTQFGYPLLLAEEERGFIADHQLQQGNPPDAPQLVPAVQRVIAVTGRPPGTVVGDRGFGTAANDQAVAALGVKRVGLQRTGTQARPGWRWSGPGPSGGCATGGSGSRPGSATSSAASGCGAPGCGGWAAPAPGSGWGSSPTTSSA